MYIQRSTADAYDWFIRLHPVVRHIYEKLSSCGKMTAASQPRRTHAITLLSDKHTDLLLMISFWEVCCRWIRLLETFAGVLHVPLYIIRGGTHVYLIKLRPKLLSNNEERSQFHTVKHSKQQSSKAQRLALHSQRQKLERDSVGEWERQRQNVFIWLCGSCRIRLLQITGAQETGVQTCSCLTDCESVQKHKINQRSRCKSVSGWMLMSCR